MIGDTDRTFYIIAEGECVISVKQDDKEHVIATQGTPSHFGEICLVQDESIRSANVSASDNGATLLSLTVEDWDLLICPQLATTAIEHNHKKISERTITVDNYEQRYFQQIFWPGLAVNAHLPSTVFPTGLSSNNLPIGLQAIGGAYMDKTTIKFAELYEKEFNSFILPDLEKTL